MPKDYLKIVEKNDFYGVPYYEDRICMKCGNNVRVGCRTGENDKRGGRAYAPTACVEMSRQYMDNYIKHVQSPNGGDFLAHLGLK